MVTGVGRTKTVAGPFITRRKARKLERMAQEYLDNVVDAGGEPTGSTRDLVYGGIYMPYWTKGVRVEKTGLFQWTLVATEDAR